MKKKIALTSVLVIFSLLAAIRFRDVFKPGMALTNNGDGLGTITMIQDFKEVSEREPFWKMLFESKFANDRIGFGLKAPDRLNIFWRIKHLLLNKFFDSDDVYDFIAMSGFILIGLAGYLLLQELGLGFFVSLIGALMFANLDNFIWRIRGHLSLAVYYMPIFFLVFCVRAAKSPTKRNMTLAGLFAVLMFLHNEYYGYFGFFFGAVVFVSYFFQGRKVRAVFSENRQELMNAGVGFAVFAVSLIVLYPDLFVMKIVHALIPNSASVGIPSGGSEGHHFGAFIAFAMDNPLAAFRPGTETFASLLGRNWGKTVVGEFMTMRFGFFAPLFMLLFFLSLWLVRNKGKAGLSLLVREAKVWVAAAIVAGLFANSPLRILSLAPFTYLVAPMFRVGARAFLYVDFAMIVVFCLYLSLVIEAALEAVRKREIPWTVGFLALAALGVALSLWDTSGGRLIKKIDPLPLPDSSIYKAIAEGPQGHVLELPYHSPKSPPELNYEYIYFRGKHGRILVNTPYFPPQNILFTDQLDEFSKLANNPNDDFLKLLSKTGVRYLVVNKGFDRSLVERSKLTKKIAEGSGKVIYELIPVPEFAAENFLEVFLYKKPVVEFLKGVYGYEANDHSYFRWMDRKALLRVSNLTSVDRTLRMKVTFAIPNQGTFLKIDAGGNKEKISVPTVYFDIDRKFVIEKKKSLYIMFETDGLPIERRHLRSLLNYKPRVMMFVNYSFTWENE